MSVEWLRKWANGKLEGNKFTAQETVMLLSKEKIVFYRDKWGFVSLLTGFDIQRKKIRLVQAPFRWGTEEIGTYLHVGHLGLYEHEHDFDEIAEYSFEVRPLRRFWKWFLLYFKGFRRLPPTYGEEFRSWLETKKIN